MKCQNSGKAGNRETCKWIVIVSINEFQSFNRNSHQFVLNAFMGRSRKNLIIETKIVVIVLKPPLVNYFFHQSLTDFLLLGVSLGTFMAFSPIESAVLWVLLSSIVGFNMLLSLRWALFSKRIFGVEWDWSLFDFFDFCNQ